jgi:hypothetical protein
LQLGASVEDRGRFLAFGLVLIGFTDLGARGVSQLLVLDRENGDTGFVINIDPSAGVIFGAAPVRHHRWQ